ncbi:MAG: hypothetical protein HC800_19075 [Phormidesmis sp. RL_2_1]|nr:hypothetical protein [Phormidesmis sp. RL_2_1]
MVGSAYRWPHLVLLYGRIHLISIASKRVLKKADDRLIVRYNHYFHDVIRKGEVLKVWIDPSGVAGLGVAGLGVAGLSDLRAAKIFIFTAFC